MIIAVTGATSFICQKLIARHLAMGDEVRYLTRSNSKPIKNATVFIGDVNSPSDQLLPFLNNADIFYHCAAEIKNEAIMHRTNVQGTDNLLKLALLGNVARWVQLSSTGIYGDQPNTTVVEETVPQPNNAYEVSKLAADFLVLDIAQRYGLNAVIIRPSNVLWSNYE